MNGRIDCRKWNIQLESILCLPPEVGNMENHNQVNCMEENKLTDEQKYNECMGRMKTLENIADCDLLNGQKAYVSCNECEYHLPPNEFLWQITKPMDEYNYPKNIKDSKILIKKMHETLDAIKYELLIKLEDMAETPNVIELFNKINDSTDTTQLPDHVKNVMDTMDSQAKH